MAYHLKYKGPAIDERLDLAGTALQEHQDISHLATKEEVAKVADAKEDVIEDLEEIRSGAKLGATSIQEHQDISHLANQADVISGLNKKVDKVEGKGLSTEDYTTAEKQKLAALDTTIKQAVDELQVEVAKKQDSIEDLEEIREGASKGATALQEHQDISNLATKEEVSNGLDNKVDKIDGKGLSTEDFTTTEKQKLEGLSNYDDTEVRASIEEMFAIVGSHNKEVRFFCIEPVTVKVGDKEYYCEANQVATVFVGDEDFEIITTSDRSIQSLLGYPIPLKWHDWLEGVEVFDGIVFDMNELETYYHWIQYYQDDFHVQKAQYANCVFWSDKPYTHSPFEQRTNYTLYYSSQLPLCYSRIPKNTYKPFYLAYGVNSDPNWRNPDYINSYSNVSGATQTFSYYGASAIGIFDMAVHVIPLPKDCRGLMYHAPAIQHAGVFDASKTTNFGAKKGSWQDAFGDCISLTSLYIQNLKASINLSWSPINTKSLAYIVNNAANTSKITISLSPYTWYRLTDEIRATAASKNITLELITTNYVDDSRWATKQNTIDDIDAIRSGAAAGATALQSVPSEYVTEAILNNKGYLTSVPDEYVTETELNGKGYATTSELTSGLSEKVSIAQVESMIAEAITNTLNTEV